MSSPQVQFLLPDLLSICPFKGGTNPHYDEAGPESAAWVDSFNVFTDRKRAYIVQCTTELPVSFTHPYAGYEQFRTCCDMASCVFLLLFIFLLTIIDKFTSRHR